MKNTILPPPSQYQIQRLLGMPAETASDQHIPDGSGATGNIMQQTQQHKKPGILIPKIPFYIRNNEPSLQEFLIY